jgi:hypothetical protein
MKDRNTDAVQSWDAIIGRITGKPPASAPAGASSSSSAPAQASASPSASEPLGVGASWDVVIAKICREEGLTMRTAIQGDRS